ncbi:MAG: ribonuclease domain-containing protein [Pseudomonadota bacterium]
MKAGWFRIAGVIVAVAILLWLAQDEVLRSPSEPTTTTTVAATPELVIEQISIRDLDDRIAWQGRLDLRPTLARIERGESDPHRGDGGVFENRERQLPRQPSGYYRKYVIRTPGIRHAGPQRLIVGRDGDLWYTPDHYQSFIALRSAGDSG